jgi:hypothetical protein
MDSLCFLYRSFVGRRHGASFDAQKRMNYASAGGSSCGFIPNRCGRIMFKRAGRYKDEKILLCIKSTISDHMRLVL